MARSKPPKDIRNRRNRERPNRRGKKRGLLKTLFEKIVYWFGAIASIVGVLAFIPRLSVEASGSIRSRDPMGTVLVLSNHGMLPIHDVVAICRIDDLESTDNKQITRISYKTTESTTKLLSLDRNITM